MRSTIVTFLGLFALQAIAAPQAKSSKSLAELLMGERIDALIDRTGEKIVEVLRTFPAGERSQQMRDFTAKIMNRESLHSSERYRTNKPQQMEAKSQTQQALFHDDKSYHHDQRSPDPKLSRSDMDHTKSLA